MSVFVQLVLVKISDTAGFGPSFNDSDLLADMDTELNDVFAIQFYTSDTEQVDSFSESDQITILAVNAFPYMAVDNMTA